MCEYSGTWPKKKCLGKICFYTKEKEVVAKINFHVDQLNVLTDSYKNYAYSILYNENSNAKQIRITLSNQFSLWKLF